MSAKDQATVVAVSVDLGDDIGAVRDRIVGAAAHELLAEVSRWADCGEHATELAKALRGDISKAIKAEVEKVIAPAVRVALESGVQPTDQYGEPRGEKTSLRSVIITEAARALHKKVEIRDNYGRSESVVQQVIRDEVQKAVASDLKEVIAEERRKVQVAVRTEAASILTEAVKRVTV